MPAPSDPDPSDTFDHFTGSDVPPPDDDEFPIYDYDRDRDDSIYDADDRLDEMRDRELEDREFRATRGEAEGSR